MATLNTIPTELITDIFSSLSPRDLAAISLVCQRFGPIALPHLYTSPDLTTFSPLPRPLQLFLRTVISRHILATHVRTLSIIWGSGEDANDHLSPTEKLPDYSSLIAPFTAAAAPMGFTRPMAYEGAHILLLLHLLPQLHRLTLTSKPINDGIIETFLVHHGADRPPSFPPNLVWRPALPIALQSVRELVYNDQWTNASSLSMITLFTLPAIRRLHLCIRDNSREDPFIADNYRGRSPVTNLTFEGGNVLPGSIAGILTIPRALTHFTYIERMRNNKRFNCAAFGRGLVALRDTLQYLCVLVSDGRGVRVPRGQNQQWSIGSLRDWPVLKSFRCPMALLLGTKTKDGVGRLVDVLPGVLSEFAVGVDWYWGPEHIVERLQNLLGGQQQLVQVTVMMPMEEALTASLRSACNAARVQLKIVMPEGPQSL